MSISTQAEKKDVVTTAVALISPFEDRCQGARDPNSYFIGVNVAAAKTAKRFVHGGSSMLDSINAFDQAEVSRMNLGQINLIEVSSFCGPGGLIWGYDVARPEGLCDKPMFVLPQWDGASVPVYDGEPLVSAAASLFGTVEKKMFPMAPGTHCPAAYKCVSINKPGFIYAACGIGIRDPREECASMLMEDAGTLSDDPEDRAAIHGQIIRSVAESVLTIAANQKTRCSKVFVAYVELEVGPDEVGCALTLIPYFSIARQAVPSAGVSRLRSLSLEEWRRAVSK